MSELEAPQELAELLSKRRLDPFLMNYKRFMIMTLLYALGSMTMSELRRALGLSWGDLDSKVRSLEERGYVTTRKVLTLSGPRTLVELTEEGLKEYEQLSRELRRLLEALESSTA
ncbi:MAG: transcriptional regulator [Thermoprotei archaeon]|nr:MAG: transcriptional regulator [Thermoprotei archaeon]